MSKPGNDPANVADEDDTRAVTDSPHHLHAAEDAGHDGQGQTDGAPSGD